jgi:hypothetical protein
MSELQVIENKIRKKEAEIRNLEAKLQAARIYVQALSDVRRELDGENESDLKAGSMVAMARDAIRKAGSPLHVDDILKAIGKTADSKSSLTGSLAAYVRRGEVFTRPAPNTYGLVDLDDSDEALPTSPPKGFGGQPESFDTDLEDDVPF